MNFLTTGCRLNKAIDKLAATFERVGACNARQDAEEIVLRQYRSDVRMGLRAMAIWQEELPVEAGRWYFITVRPSDQIAFRDLFDTVRRLVKRACFLEYTCSFEQKGTSEETLGQGAHVHIIASLTQRSKGEVLRDIASTFARLCSKEFCDVKIVSHPATLKQKYLIDYESKDEHKEKTKDWDALWRERMGLRPLYETADDWVQELPTSPGGSSCVLSWE